MEALSQEIQTVISEGPIPNEDDETKQHKQINPRSRHSNGKQFENSPTLSQINDLLLEHENMLHIKIDQSQTSYERYSQDMLVLETELEKKYKDKFGKMKSSSQEFLQHQKEAMEMIAKVTRSIYTILENIAEREIEKDPLRFIRDEGNQGMHFVDDEEDDEDRYEELKVVNFESNTD